MSQKMFILALTLQCCFLFQVWLPNSKTELYLLFILQVPLTKCDQMYLGNWGDEYDVKPAQQGRAQAKSEVDYFSLEHIKPFENWISGSYVNDGKC